MDESVRRAVRRAFDQAAAGYEQSACLQKEVGKRLDEHLDGVKLSPQRILDAGCGTGLALPLLRARFPEAELIALDLAEAMLKQVLAGHGGPTGWRGWLSRLMPPFPGLTAVCADIERMPLAPASLDLVWSNLALQWVEIEPTFRDVQRVLRPGGLFLFATFGPDTLRELREASMEIDGHAHVNRFIDMHDIGDTLMHAGLAEPVMEMERLTLTYDRLEDLLRDLRGIGAHTVLENGRRGLMGKDAWRRLQDNYERFRRDGRLPATYEVVYGHAWGAERKQDDGRQVIRWKDR